MNEFKITSDHNDLDFELVYAFISQSYWGKGMPRETLKKAISNSLIFGVYKGAGEQVGFARIVTDRTTFAYLSDVFILEAFRGAGLSKILMKAVMSHPDLQGLRRFMLATKDAHGLYAQFGFQPIEDPEVLMQIWQPDIYESELL